MLTLRLFTITFLSILCLCVPVKSEKLKVDLYLEALCPYCRRLVLQVLKPIFDSGLDQYMDLHLYYSGNVHRKFFFFIQCQHGKDECLLNKILGCGIKRKETAREWFPFVACVEQYADIPTKHVLNRCASKAGLDGSDILKCAKGLEGELIHRKSIRQTAKLSPAHKWVPWGVIDGFPVEDDIYNLLGKLCKKSPAKSKPKVCTEASNHFQSSQVMIT